MTANFLELNIKKKADRIKVDVLNSLQNQQKHILVIILKYSVMYTIRLINIQQSEFRFDIFIRGWEIRNCPYCCIFRFTITIVLTKKSKYVLLDISQQI